MVYGLQTSINILYEKFILRQPHIFFNPMSKIPPASITEFIISTALSLINFHILPNYINECFTLKYRCCQTMLKGRKTHVSGL